MMADDQKQRREERREWHQADRRETGEEEWHQAEKNKWGWGWGGERLDVPVSQQLREGEERRALEKDLGDHASERKNIVDRLHAAFRWLTVARCLRVVESEANLEVK